MEILPTESIPEDRSPEPADTAAADDSPGEAIAAVLLRAGLLTPEQLKYARRVKSKLPAGNSMLSVLQDLHLITQEQVHQVLRENRLKIRLGALLVETGYLREDDLRAALAIQKERPGTKLGRILLDEHFLEEADLVEMLSYQMGFENLYPLAGPPQAEFIRVAPLAWFRKNECVPIGRRDSAVLMAFADPMDQRQVDAAKDLFGKDLVVGIARPSEIMEAIDRLESQGARNVSAVSTESLIVRAVNEIIADAAGSDSSDIHIEPARDRLRIRFRRDGVLEPYKDLPLAMIAPLTSRIKIMAGADIAEKRRHQDGRILYDFRGLELDIRVSLFNTIHGETVVLRLLNNRSNLLDVRDIGMAPAVQQRFVEDALDAPSGVVIITGPTGSGKTTTLYASVQYLNKPDISIITAEDPVEYVMEGVNQCSINPKINVTYEDTLKHIVRQDPDVIVIGEIRDHFSADTAIQAALTGHKVLTTFHTEDSIGGLIRLLNMNIEAFLISSTVVSVVAQRLVRRVCTNCAEEHVLTAQQLRRLGYDARDIQGHTFRKGRGCPKCRYKGYAGRVAIFELLVLNEVVKDSIIDRKTSYEIRRLSIDSTGLVTLLEDGIYKAVKGLTSYDEIIRQLPRLSKPRPVGELRRLLGEA
jgi:type IV pilus assembly protein PilB